MLCGPCEELHRTTDARNFTTRFNKIKQLKFETTNVEPNSVNRNYHAG